MLFFLVFTDGAGGSVAIATTHVLFYLLYILTHPCMHAHNFKLYLVVNYC